MLRPFITFMTLIAMLLHAGIGCCWHHAHAADGVSFDQAGPFATIAETGRSACCQHHRHDPLASEHAFDPEAPPSQSGDHAPAHEDCSEGTCQYLLADVLKAPSPAEERSPLDRPLVLSSPLGQKSAGLAGDCWRRDAGLSVALRPSVRDLTKVWLI